MERRRIPGGTGRSNIAPTCGVQNNLTDRAPSVGAPAIRRSTRPLGPRPEYCVRTT
jgi:hypothetical protein